MRAIHLWLLMPALLIGLGGCSSYDPPIQGNHKAEKYQTDLTQCRTTSRETVRLRNARTLESWVISPFTGPPVVRADIRKCMQGKGYVLEQG